MRLRRTVGHYIANTLEKQYTFRKVVNFFAKRNRFHIRRSQSENYYKVLTTKQNEGKTKT